MIRYPEGTPLNVEHLRTCGWRAICSLTKAGDATSIWTKLSEEAGKSVQAGNLSVGRALWLLADCCSMMLKPESLNEPFRPNFVMDGKRSAIPTDLKPEELEALDQYLPEIDEPTPLARIADILWLLRIPRNFQFALLAISAYRKVPLDAETWIRGGSDCWVRAIKLSYQLGKGSGENLDEIEKTLLAAFRSASSDDGYLVLWLSEILEENALAREVGGEIAQKLEHIGSVFKQSDPHRARSFLDACAKWYAKLQNKAGRNLVAIAVAETWVTEARNRIAQEGKAYIVATQFLQNAIQVYRSIPRSARSDLKVDERLAELHRELEVAGQKSLDEMALISSPSFDISEIVESAQSVVRGKQAKEAITAFCNVYRLDLTQLREQAETSMRDHPLQHLFSATHMSRDGRVIARTPGMGFGDTDSEPYRRNLDAEMIRNYMLHVGLVVQGQILPALDVLSQEHRFREEDFSAVCKASPLVPADREDLLGRALYAGYDRDFVVCLHLLVPQVENLVRFHLKANNVKTSTVDHEGIENESGLSALIDLPETIAVFGEVFVFEVRAVFCSTLGPNLRNELAHGLISSSGSNTVAVVWWFFLRTIFNGMLRVSGVS